MDKIFLDNYRSLMECNILLNIKREDNRLYWTYEENCFVGMNMGYMNIIEEGKFNE